MVLCIMTKQEIDELCKELKQVLYTKIATVNMTEAQLMFWSAFEDASHDTDLLESYSSLVEYTPDISLRNLHSFIMGHAFGSRYGGSMVDSKDKKTTH